MCEVSGALHTHCIQKYSKYNELGLVTDVPEIDYIERITPICVPSQFALSRRTLSVKIIELFKMTYIENQQLSIYFLCHD